MEYMYEAEIVYECGSAREFLDPVDNETTYPTQSINCQWNGAWSTDELMKCKCKLCRKL